jgi:Mor family transcriptional regulator
LNDIIGFEAFKCLCLRYGSTKLEIARCAKLLKAVKHQTIVKEFNSGMTNAQLARKYQTDERSIRRIKNKLRQEKAVNLDLFGEFLI